MKNLFITLSLFITLIVSPLISSAHCEIPCGIYADSVRITLIEEHITTIEKSMMMIKKIESAEIINYNQLVRWVVNKEEHAKKIQDIVAQYFMHQRIKPVDETDTEHYELYIEQLTTLHKISIYAMKAKQSTDKAYIKKLRDTVHLFETAYFEGHKH